MRRVLAVAVLGLMAVPSGATALPAGSLDPTFGTAGVTQTDLFPTGSGESIIGTVVDGQGRVLITGGGASPGNGIYVARFRPDGKPDTAFDGDGIRVLAPGDTPGGVVVQSSGRIVVSYVASGQWVAQGLTDAGADDMSFGTAGKKQLSVPGNLSGIGLQDDKILLAGSNGTQMAV